MEIKGEFDTTALHVACRNRPPVDVVDIMLMAAPDMIFWADSFGWLPVRVVSCLFFIKVWICCVVFCVCGCFVLFVYPLFIYNLYAVYYDIGATSHPFCCIYLNHSFLLAALCMCKWDGHCSHQIIIGRISRFEINHRQTWSYTPTLCIGQCGEPSHARTSQIISRQDWRKCQMAR